VRRAVLLFAGAATLGVAWSGLPAVHAAGPFTAHMIRHMAVVALAAPLLALAIAGSPFDPARRWDLTRWAVPASLAELLVVWAWHAPALHHLAAHSAMARWVEQGSFLSIGLLVWIACVGHGARASLRQASAGILGLLLTSVHMTLLGGLLAMAHRPIYHAGGPEALTDQALGGVVMLLAGGAAYLLGGLVLAARLLSERPAAVAAGGHVEE